MPPSCRLHSRKKNLQYHSNHLPIVCSEQNLSYLPTPAVYVFSSRWRHLRNTLFRTSSTMMLKIFLASFQEDQQSVSSNTRSSQCQEELKKALTRKERRRKESRPKKKESIHQKGLTGRVRRRASLKKDQRSKRNLQNTTEQCERDFFKLNKSRCKRNHELNAIPAIWLKFYLFST